MEVINCKVATPNLIGGSLEFIHRRSLSKVSLGIIKHIVKECKFVLIPAKLSFVFLKHDCPCFRQPRAVVIVDEVV
jgi:hypothetical protein